MVLFGGFAEKERRAISVSKREDSANGPGEFKSGKTASKNVKRFPVETCSEEFGVNKKERATSEHDQSQRAAKL
jgi:hypothetical protein